MTGIDSWRSLREACEQYGATSLTVPALVAAVRDEAARDAGAKALEDAADVVPANVPNPRYFRDWLRDRAAALRAAPPTEAPIPEELWEQERAAYRAEQDTEPTEKESP